MALTSSFGFTNVSENTHKVTPTALQETSKYAKITDDAAEVRLSNKTTPLDQGEIISYKAMQMPKINSVQTVQNPTPVSTGVQYVVKLDEILRTKDADGNIVCDEPIVMYLTVKHQLSSNIQPSHVETIFKRLCGACMKSDGTYRFDDLMRSALEPVVD